MGRFDKETFVKIMSKLVDKYKSNEKWINDVDKCLSGALEDIIEHDYFSEVLELLTLMFDDKNEWIDYFIFECECNWFEYYVGQNKYTVNNYEELYDLIAGE